MTHVTLYLPDTEEAMTFVDEMSLLFGGCTTLPAMGHWWDDEDAVMVAEPVLVVNSLTDKPASVVARLMEALAEEVKETLNQKTVLWTQGEVGQVTFA